MTDKGTALGTSQSCKSLKRKEKSFQTPPYSDGDADKDDKVAINWDFPIIGNRGLPLPLQGTFHPPKPQL